MILLAYFRSKRALADELAAAQAANARLREQLETARLISWIRRPPKAAAPPEAALPLPRATPHPVDPGRPGRHAFADPATEVHERTRR